MSHTWRALAITTLFVVSLAISPLAQTSGGSQGQSPGTTSSSGQPGSMTGSGSNPDAPGSGSTYGQINNDGSPGYAGNDRGGFDLGWLGLLGLAGLFGLRHARAGGTTVTR